MRTRKFSPMLEPCEPRLALDGDPVPTMGTVTPQYILPALPDDAVTVEGMTLDAADAAAAEAGFPSGGDAFAAYDVPYDVVATTDDAGYDAGVIGSSWTGDVSPLPPYAPPTAIPPYDALD